MSREERTQKRLPKKDPAIQAPAVTLPAPIATAPDLTGETFGDFRILRRLGQGGMGQVYLAEQISLKRKIAIKVIRDDIAANPNSLARFKVEAKTVAQLSHANIVQVHMVGEHKGRHFMVLEYVEGKSLGEYLLRKGPLEVPLVVSIMRQVAGALMRASELGIVHRDIKPENILLNRKGEAKVADFGLSRCLNVDEKVDLTRTGATVGTPVYMSPEQIEGKEVDARSDLYSFGVTCYQMLAGKAPFQGSNAFEIALKHVREEPPPLEEVRPDIPPGLLAIVNKLMAKKPKARYQSARELKEDIVRLRESLNGTTEVVPVEALMPDVGTSRSGALPIPKLPAKHWGLLMLGAGIFAAIFLFMAIGITWYLLTGQSGSNPVAVAPAPDGGNKVDGQAEREESLRKVVDQHLSEATPNPAGVEFCIELGVLYLNQHKVADAEALFKRMDERKPPSAYHFLGRLGLAITDALKSNYRSSQGKFIELFDSKSRDNRIQIINEYLAKNPDFEKWVNEADSKNVRNGGSGFSFPAGWQWPRGKEREREKGGFPSKGPFKRP